MSVGFPEMWAVLATAAGGEDKGGEGRARGGQWRPEGGRGGREDGAVWQIYPQSGGRPREMRVHCDWYRSPGKAKPWCEMLSHKNLIQGPKPEFLLLPVELLTVSMYRWTLCMTNTTNTLHMCVYLCVCSSLKSDVESDTTGSPLGLTTTSHNALLLC